MKSLRKFFCLCEFEVKCVKIEACNGIGIDI